jgi:hypothetical protein
MKVELVNNGATDERLDFVISQTKLAVATFVEAIKNSTEEQAAVSFRAFTLTASEEESKKVFELIMSIVAVELHGQAPDMIKQYTFFHSVEEEVEVSECMTGARIHYKLLLHCDKTKIPPTKEEVEAIMKEEERQQKELNAVVEVESEDAGEVGSQN